MQIKSEDIRDIYDLVGALIKRFDAWDQPQDRLWWEMRRSLAGALPSLWGAFGALAMREKQEQEKQDEGGWMQFSDATTTGIKRAAKDLASDSNSNPEYDRALVELLRDIVGGDIDVLRKEILDLPKIRYICKVDWFTHAVDEDEAREQFAAYLAGDPQVTVVGGGGG